MKVSIIMPCLNVAKYIEQCMDSVLRQTLQDIEILVVDAGSMDGTVEIIENYMKKDSRIQLIHSEKKSYGYQVNLGISLAGGEYIGIVETDDVIKADMYENLYYAASESNVDYAKGTAEGFYNSEGGYCYKYFFSPLTQSDNRINKVICPQEIPELFLKDNFLWYGIYQKDFIKKIKLNETPGAAFQDIGALFQIISSAKRAIYLMKPVYCYRQDNLNASSYNRQGFKYLIHEYKSILPYLVNLSKEWHMVYYKKMFLHCADRMCTMVSSGGIWDESIIDIENIKNELKEAIYAGQLSKEMFLENERNEFILFMQNPMLLYNKYEDLFKIQKKQINMILLGIENKEVVIFGIGKLGKFLYGYLRCQGIEKIEAFCDNNAESVSQFEYEIKVFTPEQAVQRYPHAFFAIANKWHSNEMKNQLESLGVDDKNIAIYTAGSDIRFML